MSTSRSLNMDYDVGTVLDNETLAEVLLCLSLLQLPLSWLTRDLTEPSTTCSLLTPHTSLHKQSNRLDSLHFLSWPKFSRSFKLTSLKRLMI